MNKRYKIKSIISLAVISVLSIAIILVSVFFASYGLSVRLQGEPFQINGMSVYPNLDEVGSPLSYSAIVYDARINITKGNAVAYYSPDSKSNCKLSTAYFYKLEDNRCVLYDSASREFETIPREHLRGKSLYFIPYLGAVLSLSTSVAGIAVFSVLGAVVLLLLLIYLISYIKNSGENACAPDDQPEQESALAEASPISDGPEREGAADEAEESAEVPSTVERTDGAEGQTSEDEEAGQQEASADITLKVMSRADRYYASAVGPIEKVTKLERAIKNLTEKKNVEMIVEPIDADPSGTRIECDKQGLVIVIALVKKLNE